MVRMIVTTADCGAAANLGGIVDISSKTFDIENPELERLLAPQIYQAKQISFEILPAAPEQSPPKEKENI